MTHTYEDVITLYTNLNFKKAKQTQQKHTYGFEAGRT